MISRRIFFFSPKAQPLTSLIALKTNTTSVKNTEFAQMYQSMASIFQIFFLLIIATMMVYIRLFNDANPIIGKRLRCIIPICI